MTTILGIRVFRTKQSMQNEKEPLLGKQQLNDSQDSGSRRSTHSKKSNNSTKSGVTKREVQREDDGSSLRDSNNTISTNSTGK